MTKCALYGRVAAVLLFTAAAAAAAGPGIAANRFIRAEMKPDDSNGKARTAQKASRSMRLFLCGDVMTGRGIDQVLPHAGNPAIYESYMKSARGYVEIAERANGPIAAPVGFDYIWGAALKELDRAAPDVRIINLETSVTASDDFWKGKGIHYRMKPDNIPVLAAAGIDVCALANNHVLDWGYEGLSETLASLHAVGIRTAGAGADLPAARAAAVLPVPGKGRVLVWAFGLRSSGIPTDWAAKDARPGVDLLEDLSEKSVEAIRQQVERIKGEGDVVVASIHWGGNWGYEISRRQRRFAHQLIDAAGVDVVHGHSSHHVRAIEVYEGKLILYGCGDFLNDYEGIGGHEEFRGDLSLMYFAAVDPATGKLLALEMTPTTMRRFRIERASEADTLWLKNTLNREGAAFGTRTELIEGNRLTLRWQ